MYENHNSNRSVSVYPEFNMNILYLTNHLNVGGISSYVFSLASGFSKRKHKIFIASSGGETLPTFFQQGICFVRVPLKTKFEFHPIKLTVSFIKLFIFIKKNKIEIIHSNTRVTQVLGCLLSRFTKVAHVSTCHGFFKKRWSRKHWPCWGDRVIAISDSVRDHLLRDFGVEDSKVKLVYNGIDLDKYDLLSQRDKFDIASIKKQFGLYSNHIVGIIARISEVKGHVYLIKAMKQVLVKFPDAKLFIVGEGGLLGELKNLSKSLDIENSVIFVPKVYDNLKALAVMDVFVLPSLQEGLGLSLMEAMAASRACVGSAVGGIKNLIKHGENGLLVQPADIFQLANAIIELLKDKQKADVLAENARNFIYQNFSLTKMLVHTEEVYSECLKKE